MQQDDMLHLRELREAHIARLRVLEVQSAQLGVNCPAHVKVEIASINEALSVIEHQTEGDLLFFGADRATMHGFAKTVPLKRRPHHLLIGVIFLVLMVLFLSMYRRPVGALIGSAWAKEPDIAPRPLPNESPGSEAVSAGDSSSIPPNISAITVSCGNDVVIIFLESGLIAWKNAELDRVSMTVMPPGSRLHIYCQVSNTGVAEIVLVRRLIVQGNNIQADWIMESYQCHRRKAPTSAWEDPSP